MKLFSTHEVASILNLPNSRVRSFVRAGFIVPERNKSKTLQFNFRDLLFLKTAKSLLTFAFAEDVISRIAFKPVRERLELSVVGKLPDTELIRNFMS